MYDTYGEDIFNPNDERPQTQIIKEQYEQIKFLYGRYNPKNSYFFLKIAFFAGIACGFFGGIYPIVKELMKENGTLQNCIFELCFLVGCVVVLLALIIQLYWKSTKVYFFKEDTPFTIYKNGLTKRLLVGYGESCYKYDYKTKQWCIYPKNNMGGYLRFPYINKKTKMTKGLFTNNIKVYEADKFSGEMFKIGEFKLNKANNKLKLICDYKEYREDSMQEVSRTKDGTYGRLKVLGINTNHCVKIPETFIDFCEERGIKPPIKCKNLVYEREYNFDYNKKTR